MKERKERGFLQRRLETIFDVDGTIKGVVDFGAVMLYKRPTRADASPLDKRRAENIIRERSLASQGHVRDEAAIICWRLRGKISIIKLSALIII